MEATYLGQHGVQIRCQLASSAYRHDSKYENGMLKVERGSRSGTGEQRSKMKGEGVMQQSRSAV